jgi:hypothetical protein
MQEKHDSDRDMSPEKTEAFYKTGPLRGIVIVYMKGKKPSLQVSSQYFPGFYGGGGEVREIATNCSPYLEHAQIH